MNDICIHQYLAEPSLTFRIILFDGWHALVTKSGDVSGDGYMDMSDFFVVVRYEGNE